MRPQIAAQFCERLRSRQGWLVPDDVILRELRLRTEEPIATDDRAILADPAAEGVPLAATEFLATIAAAFAEQYQGFWRFDDFQLFPREAAQFCDLVRARFAWFLLSDAAIMAALSMRARMQPGGDHKSPAA
jgi:hypothetical protein